MKFSIELSRSSKPEWLEVVMNDFDSFLMDHANCERKASAMAMSFVAKYPDRIEIIPELIETAIEELEHFNDVYKIMEERGVQLPVVIGQDIYVKMLVDRCRSGREDRFLDRLLLASIIECRGAERFQMVCNALEDVRLKTFYKNLWISEARHGNIFVKMALNYFEEKYVYDRLGKLNQMEGEVLDSMPLNPTLH
jgi:tRNA 2-(methylsulfanyl)-N6-isopentenyladenosine37 hydroxylase